MKKIIFATGNENKMVEIRQILSDLGMEILSQKEAGIQADPEENGTTFEENALIKARAVRSIAAGMEENKDAVILADDSGLEIDHLNKEPGIYSARYMGTDTSYDIKNNALLERLEIAGENGFGYDPIFFLPEYGCTSAQLSPEKKNSLSHRGEGLRKMRRIMEERLEEGR